MAENVLEILLGGDFAKNFKQMDDNLTKIEQHTKETSERMKELVQSLDKLGGTLNGSVNTGLVNLAANFDKLNAAISKMGASSKSSIEGTANETNNLITKLNSYYNALLRYESALERGRTKQEVAGIKGEVVDANTLSSIEKSIKKIDELKAKIAELSKEGGKDALNMKEMFDAKSAANDAAATDRRIAAIAKAEEQVRKLRAEEQKSSDEKDKNSQKEIRQLESLYSKRLVYENQIASLERQIAVNATKGKPVSTEGNASIKIYRELLIEINKKIADIAERNKEAAKTASLVYDAKHLQQEVKNQEQKEAAINRVTKALEKEAEAQVKLDEKNRNNSFGVADSNGIVTEPRTIEQYRLAIANLKREMQKMPVDDKQGIEGMRKKMDEYKKKLQEVEGEQKKVANSAKGMGISLRNVASAFGIYFSVQSLKNFGKNIAEITGEFELQHRALQAIIGDTQEANRLWDKTIDLAVKSPYRVKDLVTYTKQLAAYRIETEKLYETNKMLADISSGLGVDMGRLILAFGQVKAANYLRGQELRQFSEAGVNILGELSNYFSELEGRAISTGEVFDRVSKRMVSFGDVETVLKRLTEEGGIFFNMQEIQAKTLNGMMMNLRDSFDIMLNDIGTSNRGVIVSVVNTIKYLTDNWKEVSNVLKGVGGVLGAVIVLSKSFKIEMAAAAFATEGTAISLKGLSGALARYRAASLGATTATNGFSAALKKIPVAGWIIAALSVLIGAFSSIRSHIRQAREEEEKFNKETEELRARTIDTKAYSDSIIRLTREKNELNKVHNKTEEQENRLVEIENELDSQIKELLKVNPEYGKTLRSLKDDVEQLQKEEEKELATLRAILGLRRMINDENFSDSVSDLQDSFSGYENAQGELEVRRIDLSNYIATIDESGNVVSEFIKKFNSSQRDFIGSAVWQEIENAVRKFSENSDDLSTFEERYAQFSKDMESVRQKVSANTGESEYKMLGGVIKVLNSAIGYYEEIEAAQYKYNEQLDKTKEKMSEIIEGYAQTSDFMNIKDAVENATTEEEKTKAKNDFVRFWLNFFDENAEIIKPKAREIMSDMITSGIGASIGVISLTIDTNGEKPLQEWQKKYNKAINDAADDFNKERNKLSENAKKLTPSIDLYKITNPEKQLDEARKDIVSRLKDVQEKIKSAAVKGQVVISEEELSALKVQEKELKLLQTLLGASEKSSGNGGNPALERLNKQISAIKEANQQYEKYLELFDKEEAFRKVKNEFSGLFKELSMENWVESIRDFSDSEVKNAFDGKLKSSVDAAGKKGREAAEKFATEWQYQIDKTDFDTAMKSFTEGMDEAFSQYDLYKELEKLGIGGDISEYVFGISTLSVNQLKKRLEEAKQQLGMFGNGTGAEEEIKKMEKKISEIEDKERVERLKKYTEYLIKGRDEALKIKIDELRQLAELQDLQSGENPSYTSDQEAEIREKIRKETQKLLDKNVYDSFKNSSFYTMIFDDMAHVTDRSLDVMYEKLSELREKLQELDPSQVKEIVSAMNKIEGERRSRHPFKNITEDLEILSKWNEKENDERLIELQKEYSDLANEKADAIKRAAEAQIEYDKVSSDEIEDNELVAKTDLDNANKALNEILDKMRKIGIEIDGINQSNTEGRTALDGIFKAAEKGIVVFDAIGNVVKSVSDAIVEIYGFTDESTKRLIDDIANITANQGALASNIVKAIQSKGTDVQAMAEGIINTIETIRYIVDWAGIKWVEEIEEQERSLRRLENAAEDLRDAFEGAFTTKQLTEYNRQLKENLTLQIDSYNAMIDAEQQKKNADKDQIQEWRDAISDLRKDIVDQENDFYEALGGVVDFRSASEEFVDAWYEAFKETGDGMDGLEEHFNEMLLNMVKKQAVMKVTDKFLKGIYDMIDLNLEDGELTPSEMTAIMAKAQEVFPELNEWLKTFFDSFGDFGETAENNLTGLQKGIQGVTEETAEIIAAYMNAIRFYSIDSNTQLRSIAAAVTDNSGQLNPMLVELRNIAHRTDDIYSFLYQRRENGTDSIRVSIVS